MRGLWSKLFVLLCYIDVAPSACMHLNASAGCSGGAFSAQKRFEKALIKVAQDAQEMRKKADKRQQECVSGGDQLQKVPEPLAALGFFQASQVKEIFFNCFAREPKGISTIVLDYLGDEYCFYKNLQFVAQGFYGEMVNFYPYIGLQIDKDGHNLHAQLGTSTHQSSKQLVRWNLFTGKTAYDGWGDCVLENAPINRESVPAVVSKEFAWWKAQACNYFNDAGEYQSSLFVTVGLYYNRLLPSKKNKYMLGICLNTVKYQNIKSEKF